jgi:serine/threonine protein phosphatase 1
MNGGRQTLEDYLSHAGQNADSPIPEGHMAFFNRLRTSYETEDYIFVHAGLRPKVQLAQQSQKDLVWIRQKFIYSDYNFGKRVVFGHTPFNEPFVKANKIGIDTGAVYGNQLTCVQLPQVVFFSE